MSISEERDPTAERSPAESAGPGTGRAFHVDPAARAPGSLRPGGVATGSTPGGATNRAPARTPARAPGASPTPILDSLARASAEATTSTPLDAMVRAIDAVRTELGERDGELRDALIRIARLYERLLDHQETRAAHTAPAPPPVMALPAPPSPSHDEETLRSLLHSIDTLATVTEASIARAGDLSRSMQYVVEAVQGLTGRIDTLVARSDMAEARLEGVAHTVDLLSEQMTMLGRRLSSPAPRPRPKLRAVGHEDEADDPAD